MANLNSPEQTVLSGSRDGIDRAEAMAKELGIRKAIRLNVAGAFHSGLMRRPSSWRPCWRIEFKAPMVPVISNVTGQASHGSR